MRSTLVGAVLLTACLAASCSNKDDTVSRLEGSEPQRISFGRPEAVQEAFAAQMKSCWFDGPSAPLAGYQFDTRPAVYETVEGRSTLHQVTIRTGNDDDDRHFIVQFFPFDNNTLISTRNLSLPLDLAARMKRDIETWIFGREDCGRIGQDRPALTSSSGPRFNTGRQTQPPASGWETEAGDGAPGETSVY